MLHGLWVCAACAVPNLYSLKSTRVKNNSKFLSFSCTHINKNNFELKTQHGPLSLVPLAGAFASSVPYPGICGNHPQFSLGAAGFLTSPWAGWPAAPGQSPTLGCLQAAALMRREPTGPQRHLHSCSPGTAQFHTCILSSQFNPWLKPMYNKMNISHIHAHMVK